MKVVYYTPGLTGWGRVVIGISIGNALKRKGVECEYIILSNKDTSRITGDIKNIVTPFEDDKQLSAINYLSSVLYKTLAELKPDLLLVDLIWFTLFNFIDVLPCKKIFLCHQVDDGFFSMDYPDVKMQFNSRQYDFILGIEPFKTVIDMQMINPIVLKNRDEILNRDEVLTRLNLGGGRGVCLFSFNKNTGNFDHLIKKYSYLEDIYDMVYAHKHKDGLFPEVDYFNAFDFMVCSGGYNQFWEAVYFNKEAVFEPLPLTHESQERRIAECQEFYFNENGADQLVDIMMGI